MLCDYSILNTLTIDCSSLGATDVQCWSDVLAAVANDSAIVADPLGGVVTSPCDIGYTVQVVLPTPNSCPGVYTVEYIVTDSCGRVENCFVDYSILNTLTIDCSSLGATDVQCWSDVLAAVAADSAIVANPAGGVVTSPCNIGYTVQVILPTANSCPDTYTVEYIVTDSCGRVVNCFVDYSILNSLSFDCSSLGAADVQCWSDVLAAVAADSAIVANPAGGVVTSPCNIGYTVQVVLPTANTCPGVYTVEYIVTDSCGRVVNCFVDYSILNTLSIDCSSLGATDVRCWSDVLAAVAADSAIVANPAGGVVTSPCDIGYTVQVVLPTPNSCPGVYTVEYMVTDSCGRVVNCFVDYSILNTLSIDCSSLGATDVQCWSDVLAAVAADSAIVANPAGGVVTSPCDIGYTVQVVLPTPNSCPGVYTVEYIVTDSCGRVVNCFVDYSILNTLTLDCSSLGATDVQCWSDVLTAVAGDSAIIADPLGGVVSSACNIGYTVQVILPTANACPGVYTVEYIVTDSCGRVLNCFVDYSILNTLTIDCSSLGATDVQCWTDVLAAVSADSAMIADPFGGVVTSPCDIGYTVQVVLPTANACPGVYTVEYIVTDSCSRVVNCFVDYSILNALTIDCSSLGATDVQCWSDVLAAVANDSAIVADPLGGVVTSPCDIGYTVQVVLPTPNSCPGVYTVEYIVTDSCGRVQNCFVDYSTLNTLTLDCSSLGAIGLECWSDVLAAIATDSAIVANPAGGVVTSPCNIGYTVQVLIPPVSSCPDTYTVEYIVTDSCGRIESCLVDYLIDNLEPSIICPPDVIVACDASMDTSSLGSATGSSSCLLQFNISFLDSIEPGLCAGNSTVYRIWTIEDSCGRTNRCIQTITIEDLSAPIINGVPNDTIVPCLGVPPIPGLGLDVTAADNCSTVNLTFNEDTLPGLCENSYVLQRIWTATDDCFNEAQDTQMVIVEGCSPTLTIDINPNPACEGDDITFSATLGAGYTNPVYQWQYFDGSSWVDIPGATTVPYFINGVALTDAGLYRLVVADNLANLNNPGCNVTSDSLGLIVNPLAFTTVDDEICDGQTYDFNGTFITMAGTYIDTLLTNTGCDSVITLNLQVLNVLTTDLVEELCDGAVYNFGGQILDTTGIYIDTITSSIGCDSIITLDLTVWPVYSELLHDTICAGDTYDFLGTMLNTAGTYIDTLPTIHGCDSVIRLDLVVNPVVTFAFDDEVCEGTPYLFGGVTLDSTGTYIDTLVSALGCDSIVTLNLTVHPIYAMTENGQICDGSVYDFHGIPLTVAGTYVDTLSTIHGCDSVITLDLAVLDVLTTELNEEICEGSAYNFGGVFVDTTGTYIDTLTSNIGCDSIVTLNLIVWPIYSDTVYDTICAGDTYDFLGNILSAAGSYVDTLPTIHGCDSVITLELVVNPNVSFTYDDEVCEGTSYLFGGISLDSTGTYVDTLVSSLGCDSVVTLNLTVHPIYSVTVDEQICDGSVFDFNGTPLTIAGTYLDTLTTIHGCDSAITLNLAVLDILRNDVLDTICDGETYNFSGTIVSTQGFYTDTLVSSIGCDSISTLDLTVLPVYAVSVDDTICDGDQYDFHGNLLSAAGVYVDTLPTQGGCDSIITLNLVVNPIVTFSFDDEVCQNILMFSVVSH